MTDDKLKTGRAISLILEYGGIDGNHHKQWLLDQVLRILAGDEYDQLILENNEGGEYGWYEGIAP